MTELTRTWGSNGNADRGAISSLPNLEAEQQVTNDGEGFGRRGVVARGS